MLRMKEYNKVSAESTAQTDLHQAGNPSLIKPNHGDDQSSSRLATTSARLLVSRTTSPSSWSLNPESAGPGSSRISSSIAKRRTRGRPSRTSRIRRGENEDWYGIWDHVLKHVFGFFRTFSFSPASPKVSLWLMIAHFAHLVKPVSLSAQLCNPIFRSRQSHKLEIVTLRFSVKKNP